MPGTPAVSGGRSYPPGPDKGFDANHSRQAKGGRTLAANGVGVPFVSNERAARDRESQKRGSQLHGTAGKSRSASRYSPAAIQRINTASLFFFGFLGAGSTSEPKGAFPWSCSMDEFSARIGMGKTDSGGDGRRFFVQAPFEKLGAVNAERQTLRALTAT